MYYLNKSRKLPNVCRIHKDEILYSYLVRLSNINGFSSLKEFICSFGILPEFSRCSKRYRTIRYEVQTDLYPLMKATGTECTGADEIYLNTSLYPLIFPLSSQALSSHRIGMLSRYRSQSELITPLNDIFRSLNFCPLCRIEDQQEYGEWHYHRSHQIPGVTVCHRHATPLSRYLGDPERIFDIDQSSETLPVKVKSFEYAVFARDLLCAGLQVDLIQLASAALTRMKHQGYSKKDFKILAENIGAWEELLGSSFANLLRYFPPKGKINEADCLVLLLFLFRDVVTLKKYLSDNAVPGDFFNVIREKYALVSPYRKSLIELFCISCGQYFLSTPYRIQSGWGCPNCDSMLGDRQMLERLFEHESGGDYDLVSANRFAQAIKIKHLACGREYTVRTRSFLEEHQRCHCHCVKSRDEVARRVQLLGNFSLLDFENTVFPIGVIHNDCGSIIRQKYSRFIRHPVCSQCWEKNKPPLIQRKKLKAPCQQTVGGQILQCLQQRYQVGEPIVVKTLTIEGFSHHRVTQNLNNLYRAGKLDKVAYGIYAIRKGTDNAEDY